MSGGRANGPASQGGHDAAGRGGGLEGEDDGRPSNGGDRAGQRMDSSSLQEQDQGEPLGYCVEWPDVDALSETDKATIGNTRTTAIAAYVAGGCEALIPPLHFLTKVLGFDEEEAKEMLEDAKTSVDTMTMPGLGEQGHPATPAPEPLDPKEQAKLDADTQVKVAGQHAKAPGFGKTEVSGSMTQVQGDQHHHAPPGGVPGQPGGGSPVPGGAGIGGKPGQPSPAGGVHGGTPKPSPKPNAMPGQPAGPGAPGAVPKPPRPGKPPVG